MFSSSLQACAAAGGASSWVWNLLPFPLQFQSPSIKNALKRNFFSYRRITPSTGPSATGLCHPLKGFISVHMKGEKQSRALLLLPPPLPPAPRKARLLGHFLHSMINWSLSKEIYDLAIPTSSPIEKYERYLTFQSVLQPLLD